MIAFVQRWDLQELMWVYWGQSVIIGIVNVWRMLTLKKFSTEGFTSNGRPVPETRAGKISTAAFFAAHYGIFHLVYFVFLLGGLFGSKETPLRLTPMAVCLLAFLVNHIYSFLYNRAQDAERVPNLGTIMFYPYARILPMHLTLIFGAAVARTRLPLLLFLGLKTGADLVMHVVEHTRSGEEHA